MTRGLILIVEDDEAIAAGLSLSLKLEGFDSEIVRDGATAQTRILEAKPLLVLLDIGLPLKDGVTVLSELRESGDRTPVVVLSARDGEYDKVAALKLGADDYVTKPFALAELVARIDAVLRRTAAAPPTAHRQRFGAIEVDFRTHEVLCNDEPIKLTRLEYELLSHFARNPGQVFSRRELLREVWETSGSPRTVDNFVGQLRAKLETDPEHPAHFVTVRGSGYRFDP